jgi:alanine dehydrogenase
MNIGIVKENRKNESRVSLTPAAVQSLVGIGCIVYIEKDAGYASHFSDDQYKAVGAKVVYSCDEVFGRSEIVLQVSPPTEEDCQRLNENQIFFTFLHLPVAKSKIIQILLQKKICSAGYELIEDDNENLPILQVMSEIAGQMTPQIAARLLESSNNGRGIVLGGITGVPPASVVILGAGAVGLAAARMALGAGAEVTVLDKDLVRLRSIANTFGYHIGTAVANEYNLMKTLHFADVVIGSVLIKGERTPHLVTEEMVKKMKPGSIIIDVSIDQGGCVETSHPTTLENPTYTLHDVIHYCVPNIPASVARSATHGLTNALLPYVMEVVEKGLTRALKENTGLAKGICSYNGQCTNEAIGRRFQIESKDIQRIL